MALTTRSLFKLTSFSSWAFAAQFVGVPHWYMEQFGFTQGAHVDGAATVARLWGTIIQPFLGVAQWLLSDADDNTVRKGGWLMTVWWAACALGSTFLTPKPNNLVLGQAGFMALFSLAFGYTSYAGLIGAK